MRLRPTAVAATVVTAFAVTFAGIPVASGSARSGDLDDKRRQLQEKVAEHEEHIDGASRRYAAAVGKLKNLQAQLGVARAEVAAIRGQLAAAKARAAVLAEKLRLAEAAVAKANAEIQVLRAQIADSQVELGQIARTAYQDGTPGGLAVYLDATSIDDMFDRVAYTQSASRSEAAVLRDLANARADAAARQATLDAKRAEVADLRAEAVANVARIKTLEEQAVAAEKRAAGLVSAADAAAKEIAAERAAEMRRMAAAQAEADQISSILAERARQAKLRAAAEARRRAEARERAQDRGERPRRGDTRPSPSPSGSLLLRPVNGPVTSSYGMRVHPITGVYKLHDGTDFGGGCGTPIVAARSGEIIQAGYSGAWGNRIVVDHGLADGRGLATAYNHMTGISVSGGSVRRGQVIGYVGSTGYSTGCHLHFNVYVDGNPVDPMRYL